MEALKWIGYLVAAIAVLSVILGAAAFVGAVILIGGALTFLTLVVVSIAATIKGLCTAHRREN